MPRPSLPSPPRGPFFWLQLAAGAGLIAWGAALIVLRGGSLLGLTIASVGAIIVPHPLVSMLGGLALCGLGLFAMSAGAYIWGGISLLFGVLTLGDVWREWRGKPRVLGSPSQGEPSRPSDAP